MKTNLIKNALLVWFLNLLDGEKSFRLRKIDNTCYISKVCSPYEMLIHNIFIAAAFNYTFMGMILAPVLVFDENFEYLNDEEKRFAIYHELGHCKLHSRKIKNISNLPYEDRLLIEHQADTYARNILGDDISVSCLNRLVGVIQSKGFDPKMLKERIELLELM